MLAKGRDRRDMEPMELRWDQQQARVTADGARLLSYAVAGRELVDSHQDPVGPYAYRGALLAPWPNRLAFGRWSWDGTGLQLPTNDPAVTAALHGLVHKAPFALVDRTPASVLLEHALVGTAGYPFPLLIQAKYSLSERGLSARLEVVNMGERSAPVGLGVHPYLAAPNGVDELIITLPAATLLQTDELWQETGRIPVQQAGVDLRQGHRLGPRVLDCTFTDLSRTPLGQVEVVVGRPGTGQIVLWSGASCRHLVVYTGDTLLPRERRRSIAIEPMTCPANALRSGIDLDVLRPHQTLSLDWGLRFEPGSE